MQLRKLTVYGDWWGSYAMCKCLKTIVIDEMSFMDKMRQLYYDTYSHKGIASLRDSTLLWKLTAAFECRETGIKYNHSVAGLDVGYNLARYLVVSHTKPYNYGRTVELAENVLQYYLKYSCATYKVKALVNAPKLPIKTKSRDRRIKYSTHSFIVDEKLIIIPLLSSFDATPVSLFLKILRDHPDLMTLSTRDELIRGLDNVSSKLGNFAFMYFRHPALLQLLTYGTYKLYNGPESTMTGSYSAAKITRLFTNLYRGDLQAKAPDIVTFLQRWVTYLEEDINDTKLIDRPAKMLAVVKATASKLQSIVKHTDEVGLGEIDRLNYLRRSF